MDEVYVSPAPIMLPVAASVEVRVVPQPPVDFVSHAVIHLKRGQRPDNADVAVGAEVCADDAAGTTTCLEYAVPAAGDGEHTLIIHARTDLLHGGANLTVSVDGVPVHQEDIHLGGYLGPTPFPMAAGDELWTVPGYDAPPGLDSQIWLMCDDDWNNPAGWYDDDLGVAAMARFKAVAPLCGGGLARVLASSKGAGATYHRVGFVRNDRQADTDGDGLGPELEVALGSCDSPQDGPHCEGLATLQDSDSDGLSDDIEVLGAYPTVFGEPAQHLPAWGADPAVPDLFVEVDWCSSDCAASARPSAAEQILLDDLADQVAAKMVAGPGDGRPGVRLHVDGNPAPAPSDRFPPGGSQCVDEEPVCDPQCLSGGVLPDGQPCVVGRDARDQLMVASRKGIFHHLIATENDGAAGVANIAGDTLRLQVVAGAGATNPSTLLHELGHNLGLRHHGHDTAGTFICKPNYPSVMNYGVDPLEIGLSSGAFLPWPLDPMAVDEVAGLGADPNELDYLGKRPFRYPVGAGGEIDWNRDGEFKPQARASLALTERTRCGPPDGRGGFEDLANLVPAQADPNPSAAVVQMDWGPRYFWGYLAQTGGIELRYSDYPADCSGGPASCGWPGSQAAPVDEFQPALDNLAMAGGGDGLRDSLWLAGCDAGGEVWAGELAHDWFGAPEWAPWWVASPVASDCTGDADLVVRSDGTVLLAYLINLTDEGGKFRVLRFDPEQAGPDGQGADVWEHLFDVAAPLGRDPLGPFSLAEAQDPGLCDGVASPCVFALWADGNSDLHLYALNEAPPFWELREELDPGLGHTHRSRRSPGLVYTLWPGQTIGRLWWLYEAFDGFVDDGPRLTFTGEVAGAAGDDTPFTSRLWAPWYSASAGFDLVTSQGDVTGVGQFPEIGGVGRTGPPGDSLAIAPRLDGSQPWPMSDHDDWEQASAGLCRSFAPDNRVVCPPWPREVEFIAMAASDPCELEPPQQ